MNREAFLYKNALYKLHRALKSSTVTIKTAYTIPLVSKEDLLPCAAPGTNE